MSSLPSFDPLFSVDIDREFGTRLCNINARLDTFYPISVHLGGAVMVLSKRDALAMAHTLVNAVLSLPKGV